VPLCPSIEKLINSPTITTYLNINKNNHHQVEYWVTNSFESPFAINRLPSGILSPSQASDTLMRGSEGAV
jgi:hypothetical protein